MIVAADQLRAIFANIGSHLQKPATICLIGSAPSIATGQPERQTPDMDVWNPASSFDAGDFSEACRLAGVLFDPRGELDPESVYVQIVRPGIVRLPDNIDLETIGVFGNLTVVMPKPEIIVAAKLVRGSEVDLQDVAWWVKERNLAASDIETAASMLPNERDREAALENLVFVRLTASRDFK